MGIGDWVKTSVDYGRDVVTSGWQGARSGGESSLGGAPVGSLFTESLLRSWRPAAVGAYIGALGASLGHWRKPAYGMVFVSTLVGAAIGLTTGMAWETRRVTEGIARGAMRSVGTARDEHWLERNPIDYA